MTMANADIRSAARAAHVPLWMIAEHMGISEPSMTRKLRRELSDAEKNALLSVIAELQEQEATA